MTELVVFILSITYITFFFGWWRQWFLSELESDELLAMKERSDDDPEVAFYVLGQLFCLFTMAACSLFFLLISSILAGVIGVVNIVKFVRLSGWF